MDPNAQILPLPRAPAPEAASPATTVRQVAALISFGTLGILLLTLMPSLLGALADGMGASASQVGIMASLELGGTAVGGACVLLGGHRFAIRSFLTTGLLFMIVGSLACVAVSGLTLTGAAWIFLGMGGGLIAGAAMRSAAVLSDPHRIYALIVIGQMATGFVAFLMLPDLIMNVGLRGMFACLAALCVAALLLIQVVPESRSHSGYNPFSSLRLSAVLVSASIFVHFTSNSMLWSYIERIGVSDGIGRATVDLALAASMVSGLAGAVSTSLWARRFSLQSAVYLGVAGIVVASTLLLGKLPVTYVAGVMLFNLANMFVFPAYLGFLANLPSGQNSATLGNLASFLGLMLGPAVGSRLIVNDTYMFMIFAAIALFAAALLLAFLGVRASSSPGREAPQADLKP